MNVDVKNILIDWKFFNTVATNIAYNETVVGFYSKLISELDQKKQIAPNDVYYMPAGVSEHDQGARYQLEHLQGTLVNKIERLGECNQVYIYNQYENQKYMDYQGTTQCKDKFCNNCKKVKQAMRLARYTPEIDKMVDYKKVHLTLTCPNVSGDDLKGTIQQLKESFTTLIEYLKGKKKIKGVDFESWGYKGAIRSFEITYTGNDDLHPHIHAMLLFDNKFELGKKVHWNRYSKRFGKMVRPFSDKEILIQKIWKLLMEPVYSDRQGIRANIHGIRSEESFDVDNFRHRKKKITLRRIEQLECGNSCSMDLFKDGRYHELFKYITKSNGIDDSEDGNSFMSYEVFKTLYFSLDYLHQIQGYGELYYIQEEDIAEETDSAYDGFIDTLNKNEKPKRVWQTPQGSLDNLGNYRYISRKRHHSYMRELSHNDINVSTVNIVEQLEIKDCL